MKYSILIYVLLIFFQPTGSLKLNDLDVLTDKQWTGTLTYLDYGSGKQEVIPTGLKVKASAKGKGTYDWLVTYPAEPSHNSNDEVVISKDGKVFDGEQVKERMPLPGGGLKFITQKVGEDNGKKAIFRITYLVGKKTFSRKKEVCYTGQTTFFTRNELNLKAGQ